MRRPCEEPGRPEKPTPGIPSALLCQPPSCVDDAPQDRRLKNRVRGFWILWADAHSYCMPPLRGWSAGYRHFAVSVVRHAFQPDGRFLAGPQSTRRGGFSRRSFSQSRKERRGFLGECGWKVCESSIPIFSSLRTFSFASWRLCARPFDSCKTHVGHAFQPNSTSLTEVSTKILDKRRAREVASRQSTGIE